MPFLESLTPRAARGQNVDPPRRLVVLKTFSTQLVKDWYPRLDGNGYELRDAHYGGSKADGTTLLTQRIDDALPFTQAPLRDFETPSGVSGILGPKLNPYLDKLNLIRGLDFLPEVNHNYGGLLGNFSSCTNATPCTADELLDVPTIDQVLAYSSKFYPQTPSQRYLHLSQGVSDSMSYTDRGQGGQVEQLKARTNPLDAFNDVFAGASDLPMQSGEAMVNRDYLLVDRVVEQYRALRQSPRLSSEDRVRVDQYINLMAELESKLNVRQTLSCIAPAEPESLDNNQGTDASDITRKWDIMLDLVQAAMLCDRTRVITIGVHKALGPGPDSGDTGLVGHYHSEDAAGGTWHGLAHDFGNENARRMLKGINGWVAEEFFAKLLEKLDVVEGGDSTLLDNSLVYWGNELGFNHLAYSVPCITAGGAGGRIQTGKYLDYIDWDGRSYFSQEDGNVIAGIPHNRFLVSVMQAMGLDPSDYERDGQPGYGSTDTQTKDPELFATEYDISRVGEPLPGFLV